MGMSINYDLYMCMVDSAAPELNGEKFTATFMYGSYDKEVRVHACVVSIMS